MKIARCPRLLPSPRVARRSGVFSMGFRMAWFSKVKGSTWWWWITVPVIVTGRIFTFHCPRYGYIKKDGCSSWEPQRDRCSSWGPLLFVEHICSQNPILFVLFLLFIFFWRGVWRIWHLSLWNDNFCNFSHPMKMVFSFEGLIPLIIQDHPSEAPV